MKAKNVNLNTLLYIVEADKIQAVKPDAVGKAENGMIQIAFRSKYRSNVEAKPDDEQIDNIFLIFRQQKENKTKCVKGKFKMPTKKCRTQ